jgi:alkanesulfonate monooxygenase SsuD/methylene tetrahydromethanopterin reductase-like flavin-dependent oxidoreductase (luciferase family)
MSVKFGIFDSFDQGNESPGDTLAGRLRFAVRAEELGVDHYHVTEHHGTPLSVCPSPNMFLAALSQRTERMRLGAMVYVLPAYDPLRLAEEIATLDHLSGGRLDVGVGSGVSPYELEFLGVEPANARAIYAEMLEVLTSALTTGRMSHRGEHLRDIDDVELSIDVLQKPLPPLWYASSNTRSAEWAAHNGFNFIGRWNGGSLTAATEHYWKIWTDAVDGRVPDADDAPRVGVAATVYVGETDEIALARYRQANALFVERLVKVWHEHDNHAVDHIADTDGALASGNAIVGSRETVTRAIAEQVELGRLNFFEATVNFGDLTDAEAEANLKALMDIAKEIRPMLVG